MAPNCFYVGAPDLSGDTTQRIQEAVSSSSTGVVITQDPTDVGCVHVVASFEGEYFQHLWTQHKFIIGAELFISCLQGKAEIPSFIEQRAVFNTLLKGVVLTTSQLQITERDRIEREANWMSARVVHNFISSVTHLITNTTHTQKYLLAKERANIIARPEWIYQCWAQQKLLTLNTSFQLDSAKQMTSKPFPDLLKQKPVQPVRPLQGCVVSVSGYSSSQRQVIREVVQRLGGRFSSSLTSTVTHFLCENTTRKKYQDAMQLKIPFLLTGKWLEKSMQTCSRAPEQQFILKTSTSTQESSQVEDPIRYGEKTDRPMYCLFEHVSFTAVSFTPEEVDELCQVIRAYGGTVRVSKTATPSLEEASSKKSFFLAPHGWIPSQESQMSDCVVSPNWIERCIEERVLLDPNSHMIFRPLAFPVPFALTKNKTLCISGIKSKERRSLRMLIRVLGFQYSEELNPYVDYLITTPPLIASGKCLGAKEWNIPILHTNWLFESATTGFMLKISKFYIMPELPIPQLPPPILASPAVSHMAVRDPDENTLTPFRGERGVAWISENQDDTPTLLGAILFITQRVHSSLREELEELAILTGAVVQPKMAHSITHVLDQMPVGSPSSAFGSSQSLHSLSPAVIKSHCPSAHVVSPLWLQQCYKNSSWLPEKEFPPSMNPAMKLGLVIRPQQQTEEATGHSNPTSSPYPSPLKKRTCLDIVTSPTPSPSPHKRQKTSHTSSARLFAQHNQEEEERCDDPRSPPPEQEIRAKPEERLTDIQSDFLLDSIPVEETHPRTSQTYEQMMDTSQDLTTHDNGQYPIPVPIESEKEDDKEEETQSTVPHQEEYELEKQTGSSVSSSDTEDESQQDVEILKELENLLEEPFTSHVPPTALEEKSTVSPRKSPTNRISVALLETSNPDYSECQEYFSESDDEADDQTVTYQSSQTVVETKKKASTLQNRTFSVETLDLSKALAGGVSHRRMFLLSGIKQPVHARLSEIIRSLGGEVLPTHEVKQMTHLITPKPSRSLKYQAALAGGKWILSPDYILQCQEKRAWIHEDPYELDAAESKLTAPKHWRNLASRGADQLPFAGQQVALFVSDGNSAIAEVLEVGGAKVHLTSSSLDPDQLSSLESLTVVYVDESLSKNQSASPLLKYLNTRKIPCFAARLISATLCTNPPPPTKKYKMALRSKRKSSTDKKDV